MFANVVHRAARLGRRVRPFRSGVFRLGEQMGKRRRVLMGRTMWGSRIALSSSDRHHRDIWFYGEYEPDVTDVLRTYIKSGSVFFDVGANAGYFSVMARDIGADAHAFEPNPETLELLYATREADPAGLTIVPMACSSVVGSVPLYIREETNSGMATLETAAGRRFDIETTTIDDYVTRTGAVPSVMKIDVEGHELKAIQGAEALFRRGCTVALVEVTERATLNLMASFGYDASLVITEEDGRGGLRPVRVDADDLTFDEADGGWDNFVFTPRR